MGIEIERIGHVGILVSDFDSHIYLPPAPEFVQLPYGLEDGSMVLTLSCPHCNLLLSVVKRELDPRP